ncbi:hypothetical protein Q73_00035 [Bacillus coahuilensis m2-6]|uniref:Uncharacterized protein n=1 Tax=Bacillus coahuilensis p1.1.43 TaxID=1150625 RepID=A0A147KCI9_9BACI|nr:S4 domain-containing protein YaaA [Bacillus coahuilensis]KUP09362.1 hypothetical protein Q75_00035 [Bacillus coahuilensis p1.1.43]KUP09972.1 hypothetical protein Q73_00035 [Bacillus coahuilensis m2-6]
MSNPVKIHTDYITLGQFLKITDLIQSGGMAKWFLSEYYVYVNGEEEERRGKKLYDGDVVEVPGVGVFAIQYDPEQ